jgi:hypothetical protein
MEYSAAVATVRIAATDRLVYELYGRRRRRFGWWKPPEGTGRMAAYKTSKVAKYWRKP